MKRKQIISRIAAVFCLAAMLAGCTARGSGSADQKGIAEQIRHLVSQMQSPQKETHRVSVPVYPADLRFAEYAELTLMEEEPAAAPTETIPQTEPPEDSTVPPEGTTAPPEATTAPAESEGKKNGKNKSVMDEGLAPLVLDKETIITAYRYDETTDMAKGTAIYRIQVQISSADGLSVYSGTMQDGEPVAWDATEETGKTGELGKIMEQELLNEKQLLEAIAEALQGEQKWQPCAQTGMYAQDQRLTKCMVTGRTVFYASEDYTLFQIQSYDEKGVLVDVSALSQTGAKHLVKGTPAPVPWTDDVYPVLELVSEELVVQDGSALLDGIENYEDYILVLQQQIQSKHTLVLILGGAAAVLAVLDLILLAIISRRRKAPRARKKQESAVKPVSGPGQVAGVKGIGTVHNIGGRSGQQDSFDVINCAAGTLAVVADGMGGLSDGDKVSQKIVATMRADSAKIRPGHTDSILSQMVGHTNQEVNRMLGAARQYKCGSTLLAVLVEQNRMQWITVGDSRIYLYRGGSLIQINREHIYSAELLEKAINGKMSFMDALRDPQADRLSSFIGMGELKHVDICQNRIKLCSGDRILLMSDGVFNTLNDEEIAGVIGSAPDASSAAVQLEQSVLHKRAPNQDNFTCVILEV